jgi:hypothetical protein
MRTQADGHLLYFSSLSLRSPLAEILMVFKGECLILLAERDRRTMQRRTLTDFVDPYPSRLLLYLNLHFPPACCFHLLQASTAGKSSMLHSHLFSEWVVTERAKLTQQLSKRGRR